MEKPVAATSASASSFLWDAVGGDHRSGRGRKGWIVEETATVELQYHLTVAVGDVSTCHGQAYRSWMYHPRQATMVLQGYVMEKGDCQPAASTVTRRKRTAHRRRISPGADGLGNGGAPTHLSLHGGEEGIGH
jgi:hypothetical protein